MKSLALLLLIGLFSSLSYGQKLDFDELPSVPEFNFSISYKCQFTDCWILRASRAGNQLALSFNGDSFEFYTLDSDAPSIFTELNENIVLGRSFEELFEITASGIKKIELTLEPGEIIRAILPNENDNYLISTSKAIYLSEDRGQSFSIVEQWPNETRMSIPLLVNGNIYVVKNIVALNKYYLDVRNNSGLLLNEYELGFIPWSYIVKNDKVVITERDEKEIHTLDLNSALISSKTFDELRTRNSIYDFQDTIVMYNRQDLYQFDLQNLTLLDNVNLSNAASNGTQSDNFYLKSTAELYDPLSLSPLQFDTIRPDATSTKVIHANSIGEFLYSSTEENFYKLSLENNQSQWNSIYEGDGGGFAIDHRGHIYIADEILLRSTDGGGSFLPYSDDFPLSTLFINYNDTTVITGRQMCHEFLSGFPAGYTTDGGENWITDGISAPPCFEQKFTTITDKRIYVYDRDQSYALSPGNAIYSWFGYLDRASLEFHMIEPDPSLPFVPSSSSQFGGEQVYFYVSPDETFYMNPISGFSDIGYHSIDFGETWIPTPGVPWGRIYPTPDSLGTLITQPVSVAGKNSVEFYVRYDVTQPYEKLEVTPEGIPTVDYLTYNSEGQMIIGNQAGFFHIADGITSAIEEIRDRQLPQVEIYPNPASEQLLVKLRSSRILRMEMYDFIGKQVLGKNLNTSPENEMHLDISGLQAGAYLVIVWDMEGRRNVSKVVVQ